MIFTFFVTMFILTFLFIVLYAICVWEEYENFPLALYWISIAWQLISGVVSIPHHNDPTRILMLYNFTESELVIVCTGLLIGFVTTIVVALDFNWLKSCNVLIINVGNKWRDAFPPKETDGVLKPSKKKKKSATSFLDELTKIQEDK